MRLMVLPTRSSIIVNPAERFEEGVLGVLTGFTPLSADDRRDQGARPVQVRVGDELVGANAELFRGIDIDEDLERVGGDVEVGDPPVVVRPVQVEVEELVPRREGRPGVDV